MNCTRRWEETVASETEVLLAFDHAVSGKCETSAFFLDCVDGLRSSEERIYCVYKSVPALRALRCDCSGLHDLW